MKRIFKILNMKDYLIVATCFLFIIGQVWLDLTMPEYMSRITTILQTTGSTKAILKNGSLMLICELGSLVLSILVGYFVAKLAGKIGKTLREQIYDKVGTFSKAEITRFSTPSLITRCTNDTTQIQRIISIGLQVAVKSPVLAVWAILKILNKSWTWSLATIITVVILVIFITVIVCVCVPKFKIVQNQIDDLNRVTRENLTGIRVVHAFNAEEYQQEKYEEVNESLRKTQTFTSRRLAMLSPIMSLMVGGLSLSIYWIGAFLINRADMLHKVGLFSDMIVFSTYAMQIISAFIMMIMMFMMMPRAIVSIKRINEVMNTEPSIKDGKGVNPQPLGTIEFKNVSFRYPGSQADMLSNINLKIEKGETVAFIGSTGSGKTTLIDLIPRFYDATEGEVLVDGENVKDYKLEDLNKRIGYISQKSVILSGTIFDNVTMGQSIQAQDVLDAIAYSQAKEFVENMENKENAKIYQSGKNISGGQKQRLAIARAIAKKPEILIFDDSFSALDYKTDKILRDTLDEKFDDTTRIVVAQRIGTIKDADKIIVLDQGKIVGIGSHLDLLQNNKVYRQIASTQLSKEELYGKAE